MRLVFLAQNGVEHVHAFIYSPESWRFCEVEQNHNGELIMVTDILKIEWKCHSTVMPYFKHIAHSELITSLYILEHSYVKDILPSGSTFSTWTTYYQICMKLKMYEGLLWMMSGEPKSNVIFIRHQTEENALKLSKTGRHNLYLSN